MNKLKTEKRVRILSAPVEGHSLRSTTRMAGVSINTVTKFLVDAGEACARFQHGTLRNLPCKRLYLDEIWSFCYAKQKNVPADKQGILGYGDVWTWTAICAETKLVALLPLQFHPPASVASRAPSASSWRYSSPLDPGRVGRVDRWKIACGKLRHYPQNQVLDSFAASYQNR